MRKPPTSRALAEKIWAEVVENAFGEAFREGAGPEPEDKEAALQAIEGLLETYAGLRPDRSLEKARRKYGYP